MTNFEQYRINTSFAIYLSRGLFKVAPYSNFMRRLGTKYGDRSFASRARENLKSPSRMHFSKQIWRPDLKIGYHQASLGQFQREIFLIQLDLEAAVGNNSPGKRFTRSALVRTGETSSKISISSKGFKYQSFFNRKMKNLRKIYRVGAALLT